MDLSRLFTRDPSFIHLNAGTLSRVPLTVMEYAEELRRDQERNPTNSVFEAPAQLWRAQRQMASLLGARPDDLFLRSNITEAMNDFLFGLELRGKGELLATGFEYGAIANLARVRAEQLGFSFRTVRMPVGPNHIAADLGRAITDAFTEETRVLLLSHVATGTGAILPVREIAQAARARGIVTVVDGAHAAGSLSLDIPSLGVDFYGGNFHKWFLAPRGTAFGWVNPALEVGWKYGGWASFGKPDHYRGFEGGEEAAKRLFQGTMDIAPFQALAKVVEFWEEFGWEELRAHQRALRDQAAAAAQKLGWERVSPGAAEDLGPLVSFRLPAAWPRLPTVDLAVRIFRECRVQVALPVVQGEALVRLSPGLCSSSDDISEGMERLGRFQ
jgi:isopenicillin-N epimerase